MYWLQNLRRFGGNLAGITKYLAGINLKLLHCFLLLHQKLKNYMVFNNTLIKIHDAHNILCWFMLGINFFKKRVDFESKKVRQISNLSKFMQKLWYPVHWTCAVLVHQTLCILICQQNLHYCFAWFWLVKINTFRRHASYLLRCTERASHDLMQKM